MNKEKNSYPRIMIAGLKGSSAKTILSLAITVALKRRKHDVIPFKKGPDYIDAAWLGKAANTVCRHLDLYLMGETGVKTQFYKHIHNETIALVEGNRGLFDGVDIHGTYSTARIARLLKIPVILIVDCTKATNTVVTYIMGCKAFDPKVPVKGVILNRVAGERHARIISESIAHYTGIPVIGTIPNLDLQMPERHLGLTTVGETGDFANRLEQLGDIAENYIDLPALLDIAGKAPVLPESIIKRRTGRSKRNRQKISVGIIRDEAFQFYYEENLEALENEGAAIVVFDALRGKTLKPVDLLYIAGGFPEVHAKTLSQNIRFRESVRTYAEQGMPVYGECGAVIYLGDNVRFNEKTYPMCGFFPLNFEFSKKPQGHGYTDVVTVKANPFFPKGIALKGHEFHYSLPVNKDSFSGNTAFKVNKGYGLDGRRDGIFKKNVFATYTHLHAAGCPNWAKWLVERARKVGFSKG